MSIELNDLLHRMIECYVDDLIVKTKRRADHLDGLVAGPPSTNPPSWGPHSCTCSHFNFCFVQLTCHHVTWTRETE